MREAGVSLRELARATHYDAGYLSKVLSGRKPASPAVAARVDDALEAGGRLVALVPTPVDEEDRLAYAARNPRRVDTGAADALAVMLAQSRRLEDSAGSALLLPATMEHVRLVQELATEARGQVRPVVIDMAAQWAQFAGWLHIATDQADKARAWLDRAAEHATEVDNRTLLANTLSFKGHVAWLLRQPGPTVGLSQAAQRDRTVYVGQLAYDAYQEARGHALAGDASEAEDKLAEARDLATRVGEGDGAPPWSYYYSPSLYAMEYGLVCRLLAREDPRRGGDAVVSLRAGLDGLNETERGSEWAAEFMYHLGVAHMQAGEPEQAAVAATEAAGIARATGSKRVAGQVARLHSSLAARWPDVAEVAELHEHIRASTVSAP